jgi:hypothetical protein
MGGPWKLEGMGLDPPPAPEPEPELPTRPPDRVRPGVAVQYTWTEGSNVRNLSPLDRHLLGFSFGDFTQTHPHDAAPRRLWLPYQGDRS